MCIVDTWSHALKRRQKLQSLAALFQFEGAEIRLLGLPFFFLLNCLALPPYSLWPLGFLKYVVLFLFFRTARSLKEVLFGSMLWSSILICIVSINGFFLENGAQFLVFLGMTLYFAVYFSLYFTGFYEVYSFSGNWKWLAMPLYGLLFEQVLERSAVLIPLYMGMELAPIPVLGPALLRFFGVPSLNVLAILCGLVICVFLDVSRTARLRILLMSATAFLLWIIFFRFGEPSLVLNPIPNASLRMVQQNISQREQTRAWLNTHYANRLIDRYMAVLEEAAPGELVVLPEGALPTVNSLKHPIVEELRILAIRRRVSILFNITLEGEPSTNTILLLNAQGTLTHRYDKQHTVPIIESGYRLGSKDVLFDTEMLNLGPLICFDSIYLTHYRAYKALGADLLVILSNDAFAETTLIPYWHRYYARFYSAVVGIPVLFLSQNGPSALYDTQGREVVSMGARESSTRLVSPLRP